MTLTGEVEQPQVRERIFRTLDELLEFCRFVKPSEMRIDESKTNQWEWHLQYINNEE